MSKRYKHKTLCWIAEKQILNYRIDARHIVYNNIPNLIIEGSEDWEEYNPSDRIAGYDVKYIESTEYYPSLIEIGDHGYNEEHLQRLLIEKQLKLDDVKQQLKYFK